MKKFITKYREKHQVIEIPDVLSIQDRLTVEDMTYLREIPILGLDFEANGLDVFTTSPLLLILGDDKNQFILDCTGGIDVEEVLLEIDNKTIDNIDYRIFRRVTLGANLKYDYKLAKVKYGITLFNMFDVMIAEQRLVQGTDLSSSLAAITERRCRKIRSKDIRAEFIGADPSRFVFSNKHIVYGAEDIEDLFLIREKQKEKITERQQEFLIYRIEFPLIRVLAEAELTGMDINEEKWEALIKKNKELKFKTEVEADAEFKRLRETLLPVNDRLAVTGGKFDRVRVKTPEVEAINLFGEDFDEIEVDESATEEKEPKVKTPFLNYVSPAEVINLFARFKQPAPTLEANGQPGPYVVPRYIRKLMKKGSKEVIDKSTYRFTTKADVLEVYSIENPKSPMKKLIEQVIAIRTYSTRLSTFGKNFLIQYRSRVTKKFHTIYRQAHAANSRLQSGDKKIPAYNSQNIPAETDYRECFHYEDDWIHTTDLSGAEAVIMIDKARDEKFYQMAIVNDDAHSPLAQAVWRAIGRHRLAKLTNMQNLTMMERVIGGQHLSQPKDYTKEIEEATKLANIVVSKKENKDIRTAYKNNTFGDIYGMGNAKRAKTLAISEEEAKVAGWTQKSMIPKTYAMIKANTDFALANGYLILNGRTNSRMWYPAVLDAKRMGTELQNSHDVRNSAANTPISGTQADMIKEVMVCIDKEAHRQDMYRKYGFALLKQVHDETVYKCSSKEVQYTFDEKGKKVVDSNVKVEFVKDDGTIELVTIADFIKKWHIQVCNRYLSFITMGAEQHVGKTWTK